MSIARNTLYNLAGVALPMTVAIFTIPLYLRTIGAERYGLLAIIWAILGYFSFFDLGFGRAVAQRMSRLGSKGDADRSALLWTALVSTFALGAVAGFMGWLAAGSLLRLMDMPDYARSEASAAIIWILAALPILLPISVLKGALQARLRFAEINIIQFAGTIISQLLPLCVALLGYKEVHVLVPAALISRIGMAILLVHQCRRYIPLETRPQFDRVHLKAMVAYGGWVSVMTFLAPLLVTIDRLIIAAISGPKAVTFYTVPYDLVTKSMVISGSLSSAIFPRLASVAVSESEALAYRATATLTVVMTPIVIVGLFMISPFITVWLGAEFASASSGVAELVLLGVWVNALVVPNHSRFMATGNPRSVAIIYVLEIPIYISMLYFGLLHFGIVGAAGAWSARVAIDAIALLTLNRALSKTLYFALPYSLLVLAAIFSVALLRPIYPAWHWATGVVLIILALYLGRDQLTRGIGSLLRRQTATA